MVVGDPFAEGVNLGPLASAAQRDRVQNYIQKGIDEGGKLMAGGLGAPEGLETGFYVKPTMFSDDQPRDDALPKRRSFGPVLVILPYDG
jgi:aldehyde dehydrogenase (NAD+)